MANFDIGRALEAYNAFFAQMRSDAVKEFNEGRLKASDYSKVLEAMMSTSLQLAVQVPINDYNICKIAAETQNVKRNTNLVDEQVASNLLSIQLQGWATAYKSGMLEGIPSIISSDEASMIYDTIKKHLANATWSGDTCGIKEVGFSKEQKCSTFNGS